MNTKLFFTSDTHYGHENILRFSNRPFRNVTEMDEQLVANWNEVVPEDGVVYHLGDLSFHKTVRDKLAYILWRLHGTIHFIKGNHDATKLSNAATNRFESIDTYKEITVPDVGDDGKLAHQKIILCHFPFKSWNKMHYGSWNLHGHCHGSLKQEGKQLDVGVDCNNYYPFSYSQVKEKLKDKKVVLSDYHGQRKEISELSEGSRY